MWIFRSRAGSRDVSPMTMGFSRLVLEFLSSGSAPLVRKARGRMIRARPGNE